MTILEARSTAPATKIYLTCGSGIEGIRITQGSSPTVCAFQIEDASGAKLVSVTESLKKTADQLSAEK